LFAKLKKIDLSILILLLILMTISILLVHSATLNSPKIKISIQKNVVIYIIGLVGFMFMSMVDYRALLKIHFYIYAVGIILLVCVYLFAGELNGAKGWFKLPGGLDFQPAELMKVILIITVAAWLYKRRGDRLEFKTDIVPIGLFVIVPFVLVLIQPDLGNAIIYLIILLGMVWIGNIKYLHVLIGLVIVVGGFELFLFLFTHYHDPIKAFLDTKGSGHWVVRIDTFLNPENASKDAAFQVNNSIHAIGSGGLGGEGYMKGSSIQSLFIPYAYSDSIFVVVGEEFGFRGTAILLLLYFILIYRMIQISLQSAQLSGSYIVAGVVSMFVFQIFENVGMLIGIMPLTGITLPFISYGGTSLLINMLSLGLVMSVKLHQEPDPFSIA
jgi:rod shape determining protein RodA